MKYYKPNNELLEVEHQRSVNTNETNSKERSDAVPMFYLKPGSSQVRILPPWSEAGVWFHGTKEHFIKGENDNFLLTCPSVENKFCPICDYGQTLYESKDPEQIEFAQQLRPQTRFLYNVIVSNAPVGVEFQYGKVYVMKSGVTVKRELLDLDRDVAGGFADITDIEKGIAVVIKRSGSGFNTNYFVRPVAAGRTSLREELSQKGIDIDTLELYPLDKLFPPQPEELLREIVNSGFKRKKSSMFPGANGGATRPETTNVNSMVSTAPQVNVTVETIPDPE